MSESTPADAALYRQARDAAVVFDVSDRGKIEVHGPEADRFLHNLCTNDILALTPGSGCEAFFTNAKARVVPPAVVYLVSAAGKDKVFWLDVPPGRAEKVLQHLDHYRISEQVEFLDHTAELAQLHVAGPHALAVLRSEI